MWLISGEHIYSYRCNPEVLTGGIVSVLKYMCVNQNSYQFETMDIFAK